MAANCPRSEKRVVCCCSFCAVYFICVFVFFPLGFEGSGLRVTGFGFRAQGLGFRAFYGFLLGLKGGFRGLRV